MKMIKLKDDLVQRLIGEIEEGLKVSSIKKLEIIDRLGDSKNEKALDYLIKLKSFIKEKKEDYRKKGKSRHMPEFYSLAPRVIEDAIYNLEESIYDLQGSFEEDYEGECK